MQGFANRPYSPLFSVFSMTSRVSVLHRYVARCRLSMHEKGKKRAKWRKSLIRGSLISAAVRHFISVVQAQFESVSGEAIESHLKPHCRAIALASLQISSPSPEHPTSASNESRSLPGTREPRRFHASEANPPLNGLEEVGRNHIVRAL